MRVSCAAIGEPFALPCRVSASRYLGFSGPLPSPCPTLRTSDCKHAGHKAPRLTQFSEHVLTVVQFICRSRKKLPTFIVTLLSLCSIMVPYRVWSGIDRQSFFEIAILLSDPKHRSHGHPIKTRERDLGVELRFANQEDLLLIWYYLAWDNKSFYTYH